MNTYKKITSWIIKVGLFIVPFIPLYVSNTLFFPFITGKAFVYRTIVEIIFALWLSLIFLFNEYRPKKTVLLYALTAFIAVATLATIFGANPYRSFWSNFERMEGLVAYFHHFAYFLVLASVFIKKDWKIFFNLFIISSFGQNIYALFQKLGYLASPQGGFRVDGTIGNATYVAAYSIFVMAIAGILWLQSKKKIAKYYYGLAALWALATIYFTATRGAILALLIGAMALGVAYLVWFKPKNEKDKLYKKIVASILVALVVVSAGLVAFRHSSFVKSSEILSRLASISLSEGKSRFLIWNTGLQGFKDHPILGWGPENFNIIFSKYYNPKLYTQEPWFDRSHNIIFDWLINAGVLGLLSYLGIFVAAIYILWRPGRAGQAGQKAGSDNLILKEAVLISLLFFVYFLQNLFVFDEFTTFMSFFAILAYIQSMKGGEAQPAVAVAQTRAGNFSAVEFIGLGILTVLLVFTVYYVNYKPLAANLSLLNALKFQGSQDLPKSFESYGRALDYDTFGSGETREQLSQFAIAIIGAQQVDPNFKQKVFDRTVAEDKIYIQLNPLDPRAYLFLGAVYREAGLFDQSIATFQDAVYLTPTKQQIYFELADTAVRKKDYGLAAKALEIAFNLEPSFDTARLQAAVGYILNDEQDKADQLLDDSYHTVNVPEPLLAKVYLLKKNYPRLLGIWQALVENDPKNIGNRKNLATTHLIMNNYKQAIKTLEEAVIVDPSFRQEADDYIKEIRAQK